MINILTRLLLLFSVAFVALGAWLYNELSRPLNIEKERFYVVNEGKTLNAILRDLQQQSVLHNAVPAKVFYKLMYRGRHVQTGEFHLQPGMNVMRLLDDLVSGNVVMHSLTLVEGKTVKEYAQLISELGINMQWNIQRPEALADKLSLTDYSHAEGWIAPDSYRFSLSQSDAQLWQQAFQLQQSRLQQAWEMRIDDLPLKTPYEMLILASIVEKETGLGSERARIAGVFVNRLNKRMKLQTDPTVIYGLGDDYKGNITRRHLRTPTPYNTYVIAALPPTPISNPGNEALKATAQPEKHEYFYFVGKGDGSHYFSKTLAEHNEAVRKYQLNRRADYRSAPSS